VRLEARGPWLCTLSGQPCTRNCEESPENPELARLCERLGFAPMMKAAVSDLPRGR
jgi:hypothetical protein